MVPNLQPRQYAKNLIVNLAGLLTSLATGFYLAPFLIRHLGVAAYGLVPLILGVVNYLSVANVTLNSAAARHMSVAVAQGDRERAILIFSTSLWASAAIAIVLSVVGVVGAINVTSLINVPVGFERDARFLFLTSTATSVLVLVSAPLSFAIYYSNRLDKKGMIDVGNRVLYAVLAVALVLLIPKRPSVVGLALMGSTALGVVQTAVWWRKTMPWLKARVLFHADIFRDLVWFGAWTATLYAGNLLLLTIDLVVVNRMLGASVGGIYSAVLQWPLMVRGLGSTAASVFSQPMAHIFAKEGMDHLFQHASRAVRLVGVLIVMPVVAIGGSAEPLLTLWLGREIGAYWPLLVLLMVHLGYNVATLPYVTALQAALRIRAIGVVTCVAGILNAVTTIALLRMTTWGVYAAAAAGMLVLTGLSAGFVPSYTARKFGKSVWEASKPIAALAAVSVGGCVVGSLLPRTGPFGWGALAARAGILGVGAGSACVFLVLSAEDRAIALSAIKKVWMGAQQ